LFPCTDGLVDSSSRRSPGRAERAAPPRKTDGTAAGTVRLTSFAPSRDSPFGLVDANGTLFFEANDGTYGNELWNSDGTVAGTVMLTHQGAAPPPSGSIGGTIFFGAPDSAHVGTDDEVGGRLSPETDHSLSLAERSLCRYTPEVGAVCAKAARTDLCGGREVTRVPTATQLEHFGR